MLYQNIETIIFTTETLWSDTNPHITDPDPAKKKIAYVDIFMRGGGKSNQERIEKHKKFVEGRLQVHTWKDLVDGFEELEKYAFEAEGLTLT